MKCRRPNCDGSAHDGRAQQLCHKHYDVEPMRGYVDSTAARERLALLRSRGVTLTVIAEYGLSKFGVRRIDTVPRIRKITEAKLMRVPVPVMLSTGADVDATGTRRRIQALVALGYPQAMLAGELGTTQTGVSAFTRREFVTAETAVAVRDLFDRWCMTPGPSKLSRDRARTAGWAPPLAFDNIDDPNEQPNRGVHTRPSADEKIAELHQLGITDINHIAQRLKIKPESVERQLYPSRRKDVAA